MKREWLVGAVRLAAISAWTCSAVAQTVSNSATETGNTGPRPPQVVLCFGVYTDYYKFDRALAAYNLIIANATPSGIGNLPAAGEWAGIDVLILSDVSGAEFSSNQVQEIRSFVANGGGLLTMGGPFTYGLGVFKAKGIEHLLPEEGATFDLTWEKDGAALTARAEPHPVLDGVELTRRPMVYWFHRGTLKPGAEVLIRAGDQPLLVAGTYGKGRVLCFLGTPLGQATEGQLPFWVWDGWPPLVSNMVAWLRASPREAGKTETSTSGEVQP